MSNGHPYLNNLTPLRGAAALWVVIYHSGMTGDLFGHGQSMLAAKGYMMVDLFFIMSGFIILHVYVDDFSQEIKSSHLRKFFIARFARTYPLHFFTLVFLVLIAWCTGNWDQINDPAAIPTNLLLLQSFGIQKISTWNRPSWSISAEWAAYILFPFLALFFNQKKKLAYIILPIFIVTAYLVLDFWLSPHRLENGNKVIEHNLDVTFDYGFVRGVSGFSLGALSYGLYSNIRIRRYFSKDISVIVFTIIAVYLMREGVNDIYLILPFVGLVLAFASNSNYLHKLCTLRPAQFIGKISYSIYLVQGIAPLFFATLLDLFSLNLMFRSIGTFSFLLENVLYTIFYLLVLIALSSLTYHGIENPCRNFINRNFIAEKNAPALVERRSKDKKGAK